MRIILFTGKGGVGKTTIAAATGITVADEGKECLVISTDPAHSLSDSFDRDLGPDPVKITENLYAQEIDVQHELNRYWGVIKNYLITLFRSQGLDDVLAEELAVLPGFDELASLLYVLKYHNENGFDCLILDCAPTGETLRLLSFPEMARWYMDRFFGIEKKLLKLIRPVAESVTKIPMPTEEVMDNIEELYINLSRIKDILEGDSTTVRLVSVPEKMVIRETQRAYTYLNLFGYNVDLMIINKVIPELDGGYLTEWRKIQEKYLDNMANIFSIPRKYVKLYQQEVYGLDLLRKVGEEIYRDEDPLTRYVQERPMKLFKKNGEYVLSLRVPFAKKEEIDIMRRGDELIIITKNWKRILFLPQVLSGKEAVGATFTDDRLEITFNEKVI